jgi:hypothetical protein
MSKVEREYVYKPSRAPLLLGILMLVLAPIMVVMLNQPTTSDLKLRVRGFGYITLTPAQQPIAGWIIGAVLLLLGVFFVRVMLRKFGKPGRVGFTEKAFFFSEPLASGGEVVIPFRTITDLSRSKEGRRSRLTFTCGYGKLEVPASRMASLAEFDETCTLLHDRVEAARAESQSP